MLDKEIIRAAGLVQEVLKPGRPGCNDGHRAYACWIGGKCLAAVYHLDAAQDYAKFATEHALAAKETGAMSLANSLKAEIEQRRRRFNDEAVG